MHAFLSLYIAVAFCVRNRHCIGCRVMAMEMLNGLLKFCNSTYVINGIHSVAHGIKFAGNVLEIVTGIHLVSATIHHLFGSLYHALNR